MIIEKLRKLSVGCLSCETDWRIRGRTPTSVLLSTSVLSTVFLLLTTKLNLHDDCFRRRLRCSLFGFFIHQITPVGVLKPHAGGVV